MSKKSAKIAALIDACRGRDLDAHYLGYFECFNQSLFYEAHDVLEELWLADRQGPNYSFYKGLIQLAGAFVHLQKNRLRPAAALFKLARTNLQKYPAVHEWLDVVEVLKLIEDWLGQLEGGRFELNPLTTANAPRLELLPRPGLRDDEGMATLLIATRNEHKVEEIRAILSGEFRYLTLRDFPGAPTVIEDAATFGGNAAKKATELARFAGEHSIVEKTRGAKIFVLADDSGLEVDALKGAPGVHSARFAAVDAVKSGNCSDAENNAKLLRLMREIREGGRGARFRCVMALTPVLETLRENASPVCGANEAELGTELFEGACEGRIALEASGSGGFGYDPLFIPDGHRQSFAELGEATKNQLSHRAKALAKVRLHLSALSRTKI